MSVENKYVNAAIAAGKLTSAAFNDGAKDYTAIVTFEVAVADDDGSVYRVIKNVNENLIVSKIELLNDAIAGATSYDIGVYESDKGSVSGPVIDKDVFLAAEDINAGNARGSAVDGLGAVDIADSQKRIFELVGDTLKTKRTGYDIAVTANTVGSAVGTITLYITFTQG